MSVLAGEIAARSLGRVWRRSKDARLRSFGAASVPQGAVSHQPVLGEKVGEALIGAALLALYFGVLSQMWFSSFTPRRGRFQ